jgi:hypothetical protein
MLDNTPSKVPMAPTHYRDGEVASDNDKVALTPPEDASVLSSGLSNSFGCVPYLALHFRSSSLASGRVADSSHAT